MIRHPLLLAGEAICALAIAVVTRLTPTPPIPKPPELAFTLSALGEAQLDDGSWQGVDLLGDRGAAVDRFQLTIRPDAPAQLAIDVVGDGSAQRLFPPAGQDGRLRAGTSYSLPGPHGFYELRGRTRLRISMRPTGVAEAVLPFATPLPEVRSAPFRLSDGAPFSATERAFAAKRGGELELELRGHQGEVTPTPAASE